MLREAMAAQRLNDLLTALDDWRTSSGASRDLCRTRAVRLVRREIADRNAGRAALAAASAAARARRLEMST